MWTGAHDQRDPAQPGRAGGQSAAAPAAPCGRAADEGRTTTASGTYLYASNFLTTLTHSWNMY